MEATGDEEADMEVAWVRLEDAVDKVMRGEIVNSIACSGILAAYAVLRGGKATRSVDALSPEIEAMLTIAPPSAA